MVPTLCRAIRFPGGPAHDGGGGTGQVSAADIDLGLKIGAGHLAGTTTVIALEGSLASVSRLSARIRM
jgi:hypothetical protein